MAARQKQYGLKASYELKIKIKQFSKKEPAQWRHMGVDPNLVLGVETEVAHAALTVNLRSQIQAIGARRDDSNVFVGPQIVHSDLLCKRVRWRSR